MWFTLESFAFGLVLGAQFIAAIVLISKRASIYSDARRPTEDRFVSNESSAQALQEREPARVASMQLDKAA